MVLKVEIVKEGDGVHFPIEGENAYFTKNGVYPFMYFQEVSSLCTILLLCRMVRIKLSN